LRFCWYVRNWNIGERCSKFSTAHFILFLPYRRYAGWKSPVLNCTAHRRTNMYVTLRCTPLDSVTASDDALDRTRGDGTGGVWVVQLPLNLPYHNLGFHLNILYNACLNMACW
jgi:hypothetical protein